MVNQGDISVWSSATNEITLSQSDVLGSGGEGAVYGLRSHPDLVTTTEFVIGSHGITIVQGKNTWLPLAPDVAISFSNKPGHIDMAMCINEFVEDHNRAALSASERIPSRSKDVITKLLATLD